MTLGVVLFALAYAAGATISVAIGCLWAGWQADERLWTFLALVAASSFLAALVSWFAARMVAGSRPATARFAAMLIALTVSTALVTAFLFFLMHFLRPGNRHPPVFSRAFLVELFHSGLAVTYLFIVTGLRLFFPVGLAVMIAASVTFARRKEL